MSANATSPTPLRVLFILDEFPDPYSGTEGQFWLLFRNLDRARVAPAILLLRPSEFLQQNVPKPLLTVLGVQRLMSARSCWRVLRAAWRAKRSGFEVAHIFFNDSTIVFPIPLKMFGIRVIVSRRDLGIWYTDRKLTLLKLVAKYVDRAVANCEAVRTAVIQSEKFRPERVDVIYNGLRRELSISPSAARTAWGVPEDAHLIVIVANVKPLKKIDDAIAMLARVQQRVGETHLLVIGEDHPSKTSASHQNELLELAKRLGVTDKLHFAGKMSDPMPAVAAADLCLLCSETEGLSNTVIEYMLAGKPAVCTAIGGNPELVLDGQTGYLVPVGDIERLAHAVANVLGNRELARSMGECARQRALSTFTAQSMVQKQTELYERLASGVAT